MAALALLVTGCGGGSDGRVGGTLPECAQAGQPIVLPGVFPPGFPLPDGTVIDNQRRQPGGFTVVEGFVPGDLEPTRDYFQDELPAAGFPLGEGDAEEHEAETDFSGRGVGGHLKLHDIAGCEGALTIEVVVARR